MKTVMTSKRPEKDRERLKVWILLDSWANYAERAELIELVCEIGLLLAVVMLFRGLGPSKKGTFLQPYRKLNIAIFWQ